MKYDVGTRIIDKQDGTYATIVGYSYGIKYVIEYDDLPGELFEYREQSFDWGFRVV